MSIKIGVFGGSFDPFHIGHRRIIDAALAYKNFDKFLVVPTSLPSYKDRPLFPGVYRYKVAELSLEDLPQVSIKRTELNNTEESSYTVETLKVIKEKFTEKAEDKIKISLIFGSDALDYFEHWFQPEGILAQAKLLIALRGDDIKEEKKYKAKALQLMKKFGGKIEFFPMQSIELSSTELREDLEKDIIRPRAFLQPVVNFLSTHKPYTFTEVYQGLSKETHAQIRRYEMILWDMIPQNRLIHSTNVAMYAAKLADYHGIDTNKAYIAGLLHDACKTLPIRTQFEYVEKSNYKYTYNEATAHGPAAAYWAKHHLGIKDKSILHAIKYHVTARPGLSDLEKIIFLADKAEFGRPYKRLDVIRRAAKKDLDDAMRLCLNEVEIAMKRKFLKMHELTVALMLELGMFK